MLAYIRHPLTYVWAFLTATTLASWLISRDGGSAHQLNAGVTICVLLIAAVKSRLVIRWFMEVRHAPRWLKRATDGWLAVLFLLLSGIYFANL